MSGKIAGLCWDLELNHRDALILQALADHADHEGNNAYPSLDLLAWKTGYSEQTIRRALSDLTEAGILTATKRPGKTTVYSIHPEKGKKKAPRNNPLQNVTPDKMSPHPLHLDVTPTPDTQESPETSLEPSNIEPNAAEGGVTGAQESQNGNCDICKHPYRTLLDANNVAFRICNCQTEAPPGFVEHTTPIDYQPSPHCEPTQPQRKTVRRQDGGFSATTIDPFADKNDPNAPPPSPLIPTYRLPQPRQCETCGGQIMQVITQSGAKHNTCACTQHRLTATKNSAPTPQAPPLTPESLTSKHIDIIAGLLIAKRPQSIRGKKAATEELLRDGFIRRSRVRVGGYELTDKGAALADNERVKKAVEDKQNAQGYAASFMPNGGKKSDTKKVPYLRNDRDRSFYDAIFQAMDKTPDAVTISTRKFYAQVAREIADVADAVPADVLATAKYLQRTLDGKPFTPKAIAQWLIVGAAEQKTQYLNAESPPEDEIAPGTKPATPEQIAEAKRLTDQILGKSND
jgi:DNA-binding PadR family transcriptional regulator